MKLIKKFLRSAKSKGGYTLIEIAAVVAITATLGAVVVPIALDKTTEGKIAGAKEDTKSIGGAIAAFYKDVGYFPGDSTSMKLTAVGSATVLYSGDPSHIPTDLTSTWPASNKDLLDNWLVKDNPGSVTSGLITGKLNWKGPYSESFSKKDPWGNDYMVYAGAMYNPTSNKNGTKQYGWIISAGPNASIETAVTDATIKGDDIGSPLFSAEAAH